MAHDAAGKTIKADRGISWLVNFHRLQGLEPSTSAQLVASSSLVVLQAGTKVFQQGQACKHYILIAKGSVRVGLTDPHGHEVTLYRLKSTDSCILTTASLLANDPYSAWAITETKVEAVLIPKDDFMRLLVSSDAFREMVFTDHGQRLVNLMGVIGHLAFKSIDYRLAEKLEELADADGVLRVTHETLAVELGTAREVVSRRLKHLAQNGYLSLQKGRITLLPSFLLARRRLVATSLQTSVPLSSNV